MRLLPYRLTFGSACAAALVALTLIAPLGPLGGSPAGAAPLRLSVRGATYKPFPVAVVALAAGPDGAAGARLAAEATALLRADTDFARALELLPPSSYLQDGVGVEATPNFGMWTNIGASGLISGEVVDSGAQARLRLRFHDVAAGRLRLDRSCQVPQGQAGSCVHRFLDEVVRLLSGEEGVFSSRLAFVTPQGRGKAVMTCDVDGADRRLLTEPGGLNLLPAWDPRGKFVLFTSFASGNPDLYRLMLAGGRPTAISHRRGLNTGGAVSPDGSTIALTLTNRGNTQVFLMDAAGGSLRPITNNVGQNLSPTWSPDGRRLAFVSSRSGAPHIYTVGADGQNLKRLTFRGTYNQEPDWSPRADGQIAFTARDEQLKYDIFLVHPDSGEITRLTQEDGHNDSPCHSPDGHHLAFTSSRGGAGRRLMVMDVDGRGQRGIPGLQSLEVESPAWGPRLGYQAP